MKTIVHVVDIKAPRTKVYESIASSKALSAPRATRHNELVPRNSDPEWAH